MLYNIDNSLMYPGAHYHHYINFQTQWKGVTTNMSKPLNDESLFVLRPNDEIISEEVVLDPNSLESASNLDLLTSTYNLLRSPNNTKAEALALWELRLVLLLFENHLTAAKREAVNLNNALYLLENPDAASPSAPGARPPVARTDSIITRRPGSPGMINAPGVIYPLPKNNDGAIGFSLLLLILRLKLAPNLSLVNELYKLCYQLRLKGRVGEEEETQKNLISLSYEIIMVLTITRNYYTLLSFLKSLESDLEAEKKSKSGYNVVFASNVSLMIVLANMLILQAEERSRLDVPELRQRFENLNAFTTDCFVNVLRTFSPMVSDSSDPPLASDEELSFEKLIELIKAAKLTGRVTCCTLASFELGNMLDAEFEAESEGNLGRRLVAKPRASPIETLEKLHAKTKSQWGSYIHKVYGIE